MSWEMQVSSGSWVDAPFKPPARIEEGKKATFTFQGIACTIEFTSVTEAKVMAKDKVYAARPKALEPLDAHEVERKVSQRRVSQQSNAEQMKIIAEMEHAEHDLKEERKSNRASAVEAMEKERSEQIADFGDLPRKHPSVPDAEQLADLVPGHMQHTEEHEQNPTERKKSELSRNSLTPLDTHEEDRKVSQRKASNAASAEQLRVVSEMEHAEHDLKSERKSNRASAVEAMEAERESRLAEHGDAVRKVPSVPNVDQLADVVPKDWQEAAHTADGESHGRPSEGRASVVADAA